jgi:hypothetical protein
VTGGNAGILQKVSAVLGSGLSSKAIKTGWGQLYTVKNYEMCLKFLKFSFIFKHSLKYNTKKDFYT